MIIHPVIFIAPFEPAFNTLYFYERAYDREPTLVKTEDGENPEYEIERLNRLQYFVKWKKYGMEHNTWYNIDDFQI